MWLIIRRAVSAISVGGFRGLLLLACALCLINVFFSHVMWLQVVVVLVLILAWVWVGEFGRDLRGIKEYLALLHEAKAPAWETLIVGPLTQLREPFAQLFKHYQRRHSEYLDAVKEMSYSSLELANNAEKVSESAAYQSNATTSSAAAITEISHSVDDISQRIDHTRQAATEACEFSAGGSKALIEASAEVKQVAELAQATEARVTELDALMQNVTSMSRIIGEISGQTNLLALNAAIEAARAGEYGRGFAVVADEVRALAQRSQTSATDIASNIARVQESMQQVLVSMGLVVERTDNCIERVQQADTALQAIEIRSSKVFTLVDDIAVAASQQSVAAREISNHIETLANLAHENSFRAKQAADIAHHLHGLTQLKGSGN